MSNPTKSHESHQSGFTYRTLFITNILIGINIGASWFELTWQIITDALSNLCIPTADHETQSKRLSSIDENFILYHSDNLLCKLYKY